ncbi:YT521-B-like domain-containing protein [Massariosphaeria phaeospora]|uniref:YT521-B-like domain-containing protein n=1 Tax=Massariosphaeria phaeospora TaxID=100035 RepID=A0A7C8IJ41_9PLEO|nr:YT521-B-like domain-containing protein [Massariosphaeria phaeospora]
MAFVWLQQWIALPVVVEEQMGDMLHGPVPHSLDITAAGHTNDEHQKLASPPASSLRSPGTNAPFHSQLSSIPHGQSRPDHRLTAQSTNPSFSTHEHGAALLTMGQMAGALPEYASVDSAQGSHQSHQHSQRPLSGASTSALVYQLQQGIQMPSHPSGSLPAHSPYNTGFAPGQYQQNFVPSQGSQHASYAPFPPSQQRIVGPNTMQGQYQNFAQPSQYLYYPSPYGPQAQFPQGFAAPGAQNPAMFTRRLSQGNPQGPSLAQNPDLQQQDGNYSGGGRVGPGGQHELGSIGSVFGGPFMPQVMQRPSPTSSIPRGPPRKPKQSGHALWVGNLPPGTTVTALKDHFSRDATKDIESVFLISKSNCAFVNYRSETSCTAAMHRFHDSRFNGVRLVCRLRRSSAPASGVPTGPSAMVGHIPPSATPPMPPQDAEPDDVQADVAGSPVRQSGEEARLASTASDKYFIVKSLTLQDLELSVRNGIWATQSHNEETLNKAYRAAENVYLIFSANKSGEYFGYARMVSSIIEDANAVIGSAPKPANISEATDIPKSIPTPATEFAPKGRIIDDSARGTIFWEAELSDAEVDEEPVEKEEPQVDGESSTVAESWGKPFKIEWVSTNRLPFYRTRGLRNPWNANREVKIARDGTELETSVGERLVQMFHRLGPSGSAAAPPMMQLPQLGAPPMRPY